MNTGVARRPAIAIALQPIREGRPNNAMTARPETTGRSSIKERSLDETLVLLRHDPEIAGRMIAIWSPCGRSRHSIEAHWPSRDDGEDIPDEGGQRTDAGHEQVSGRRQSRNIKRHDSCRPSEFSLENDPGKRYFSADLRMFQQLGVNHYWPTSTVAVVSALSWASMPVPSRGIARMICPAAMSHC